jgi:hypothetical protein
MSILKCSKKLRNKLVDPEGSNMLNKFNLELLFKLVAW